MDDEIAGLATRQGLCVRSEDLLPPVVGFYADRRLYLRRGLTRATWRVLMPYTTARLALYGANDAAVMQEEPRHWDQRKERAMILAGYLMFGPGMHDDLDRSEAAEVAKLAEVPVWFVIAWSLLARRADALSEIWRNPALGRRARVLAARKALTLA